MYYHLNLKKKRYPLSPPLAIFQHSAPFDFKSSQVKPDQVYFFSRLYKTHSTKSERSHELNHQKHKLMFFQAFSLLNQSKNLFDGFTMEKTQWQNDL